MASKKGGGPFCPLDCDPLNINKSLTVSVQGINGTLALGRSARAALSAAETLAHTRAAERTEALARLADARRRREVLTQRVTTLAQDAVMLAGGLADDVPPFYFMERRRRVVN